MGKARAPAALAWSTKLEFHSATGPVNQRLGPGELGPPATLDPPTFRPDLRLIGL